MLTGQPDAGNPSAEKPSFQATLVFAKLTKSSQHSVASLVHEFGPWIDMDVHLSLFGLSWKTQPSDTSNRSLFSPSSGGAKCRWQVLVNLSSGSPLVVSMQPLSPRVALLHFSWSYFFLYGQHVGQGQSLIWTPTLSFKSILSIYSHSEGFGTWGDTSQPICHIVAKPEATVYRRTQP